LLFIRKEREVRMGWMHPGMAITCSNNETTLAVSFSTKPSWVWINTVQWQMYHLYLTRRGLSSRTPVTGNINWISGCS
jgi:hypothetical protein